MTHVEAVLDRHLESDPNIIAFYRCSQNWLLVFPLILPISAVEKSIQCPHHPQKPSHNAHLLTTFPPNSLL